MTRRALPKPVEAWALISDAGNLYLESLCWNKAACIEFREDEGSLERVIRVRIVPITPKKRTKRKEKKK